MSVEELARQWLAHEEARPGQREMIHDGIEALRERGCLIAAAPTGIGKTAASLASALAVARSSEGRRCVMFLTSRQSQHRIVVDTVRSINDRRPREHHVTLVDMIGQAGMCVQPFAEERPAVFSLMCASARRDRSCKPYITPAPSLPNRILEGPLHVEELVELTRHHREGGVPTLACPWRAAREAAARADVVVADYNHLFNEGVRDSTLSALGLELDQIIIVVDEAHNLPDRIRSGLERRLTPLLVRNAKPDLEEHLEKNAMTWGEGPHVDMIRWTMQVVDALAPRTQAMFTALHTRLAEAADEAMRQRQAGPKGAYEPTDREVQAQAAADVADLERAQRGRTDADVAALPAHGGDDALGRRVQDQGRARHVGAGPVAQRDEAGLRPRGTGRRDQDRYRNRPCIRRTDRCATI